MTVAAVTLDGVRAAVFGGLPLGWQIAFTIALVVVVVMFAWSVSLYVRAVRWERRLRRQTDPAGLEVDDVLWVFMVPALNEAVTIRDSVTRLLAVEAAQRQIVVIDDGSDDATPEVLATFDHPDLRVVRREPPDARVGKAAALNHAYATLDVGGWDRDRVVVAIVDADGRLAPDAPSHVVRHFADPAVGGVQSLVRIYNRRALLGWFQDVEFGVYGHLFQAGRNRLGTAGMGGNGQFNRLSALDDVAGGTGPWRDRLTEDQDLGLRLTAAGWLGRQDLRATVHQQGLSRLRPLLRQRTRWSQGNLQAIGLTGAVSRAPVGRFARLELVFQLLMPLWQSTVGVALVGAVILAATGVAPVLPDGSLWYLVLIYMLAFGGTVLGCVAARRGRGLRGRLDGFVVGHAYSLYTWLLWPVLVRAVGRQLRQRRDWAKTGREPIEAPSAGD